MRPGLAYLAFVVLLASAGWVLLPAARAAEPQLVLRGLDPIELVAGREVPGRPAISSVRGAYRYQFASEENKRRFEAGGERYAVQIGGACAKMGPLSGKGSPDRFLVFDGRIFLFASDSCRNAFTTEPEKYVDRADPAPTGTPEQAQRASVVLEKAIAAVGGPERLRDLAAVQERRKISGESGGTPYSYTETIQLGFPESIRVIDDFGGSTYGWALEPAGAVLLEKGEATPTEPSVTEFVRREYYRHPLALLEAWQRGAATAFARGPARANETALERVTMHAGGATTTLGIDPATGRVVEASYRGRITRGISEAELRYSDFRDVDGILVPFRIDRWANGAPLTQPGLAIESVEVRFRTRAKPPVPQAP